LGIVAEIFPLEGAGVFGNDLLKSPLNVGCRLHVAGVLYHFVDGAIFFANKVFSIFVQLAFKYRQNNIHCIARLCFCIARSTSSWAHILIAPPSGQSTLVSRR